MNQATPPSPSEAMIQIVHGMCLSRCVSLVAELSVADLLASGPASVWMLGRKTGTDPDSLYRVLRTLSAMGVFEELPEQQFQNTPLSEALLSKSDSSVRDYARFFGCPLHWQVWGDLDYSVRTGSPATTKDKPNKTPFDILAENPSVQEVFNGAMTAMSATESAAVVEAYDFSPFRRIVDVGGGHGELAAMIALAAPESRVVAYDLPQVIESASNESSAGLIEFAAGDCFQSVPGPADLCVLKHIVHDWDDENARKILISCRNALSDTGRLLVCEMMVGPQADAIPALVLDIEMLAAAGGRERTKQEFAELFRSAGLCLHRIIETRAPIRLLEAVAGE